MPNAWVGFYSLSAKIFFFSAGNIGLQQTFFSKVLNNLPVNMFFLSTKIPVNFSQFFPHTFELL